MFNDGPGRALSIATIVTELVSQLQLPWDLLAPINVRAHIVLISIVQVKLLLVHFLQFFQILRIGLLTLFLLL